MNRYAPNGQLCWTSATPTSSPSCSSVPASATTFNYDLNGNRTSTTSPLSSTSLTWQSSSGRLVCVNTAGTTCSTTSPSATTTLYSYDADGHRTASSNNGVTNAFIWDTGASQLLADSTHDYVYLQGSVSPDLQINLATGTVDLLIQDQNANTRGVVQVTGANSALNGTIVNYTDYDAYGNAITQSGGSINPGGMSNGGVSTDISTSFAFGAGYWDASNLTYLVHRYLDNETGQFISVDPLVDHTRQAYVYAGDEAISQLDVMGLTSIRWKGNSGDGAKALTAARTKLGAPYYYGFENSVPNRGNNLNDYLVCHSPTASAPYGIVKVTPVGSNSGTGNCTAARVKVGGKPGFDCSGLTQWSWSKIFPIGRDTRSQSHYTKSDNGKTVLALIPTVVRYSPGMTLTAGDLVFYGSTFSHVAMASTAGQVVQALCTGDTVRETTITYAGTPTYVRRMS